MKMKWTIVLVFALSIGAIIVNDFKKINRLREQKQELEHSRIALLEEMYGFSKVIPDERSAKEMAAIYKDIAMAYTNGNLLAMYKGIARLPRVHDQMTEQSAMKIMAPFIKALNESFLLIRHLRDFTSVEEFDRYVQVSLAAVRFYGETEVRRKNGDPFPAGVECLALGVLQKYCKKFHDEGRGDLEKAAEHYLELWIARIESIDGLTRQCVWQAMRM